MSAQLDAFLSLLVVTNVVPILPIVLDTVEPLPRRERTGTLIKAQAVGHATAISFLLFGSAVLAAMGSDLEDLRVAGGAILLVFAIYDLLFSREQRKEPLGELIDEEGPSREVGLVPLGVPLMIGPASLTTAIVLREAGGLQIAIVALLVNGLINVGLLSLGTRLLDVLGRGIVRTVGKIFALLLAAMAVSLIRTGIINMGSAA